DIYFSKKILSGAFDKTERITNAVYGTRMCPKMAIDNNNTLHLVWFDRRNDSTSNKEIYYKRTLYPVSEKPIIVTQLLNQTTCKPGDSITVSGNAVYNDSTVPNADVTIKILEKGNEWNTTTDLNGDYSEIIVAPNTPGNYTIMVTITWNNITSGNHTGWKMMRLTVEQESTTNGGTTNDGTTNGGQPGGEENKYGVNLNYVIGIVVIAVCVIIGVILVKRRGKTTTKTTEKKTEKNTMNLRCPKCRQIFRVELKPKPFNVKCPYCGKEGMIK
ncbi:MAG: carboxypeptidase-like regulatory domain-containing protein, partial [Thermoplasmatales archaeon]|nr:carboxypeptidase-like regulatory domain-containing protein [Thermoplasmatales archaeon]